VTEYPSVEPDSTESGEGNVRSVERAIAILFGFTRGAPIKTVAELQSELGISRATLYRLLQTLERQGLVHGSGEPLRYSLSHNVMKLAGAWLAQVDVARCAEESLTDLWARTDETLALHLPINETTRISVKELRSKQPLSLGLGIGHTAPTTQGASGRAILAFFEPKRIEEVLRGVSDGLQREHIRADLERIRARGYSITISERIVGAVAIAAPIFDNVGSVAASLCLIGPEARLTEELRARYISLVLNAAAKISTLLGFDGQPRFPREIPLARQEAS